jgi:hypothetical protein
MKTVAVFASLVCVAASFVAAQEFPTPEKEHGWLAQFAGEWTTEQKASMGPGQPEMECEGTISAKMLGEFWVVSQFNSNMMGIQISAIQTIGYDPAAKKYVGTWVDSMTDHMWKYEGTVDAAGKKLTLEAEGPNFMQAGKTAKFRDAYEFKGADAIVISSSMQGEDGKWLTFMTGTARRKK